MSHEKFVKRDARIKARMDERAQRLGWEANETKRVVRDWKRVAAVASDSSVAVFGTSAIVGVDSYLQDKAETGPRNSDLGDATLVTLAVATTAAGFLVEKFGSSLSPIAKRKLRIGAYSTAAALALAACASDGALPTVGVTYVPETPTVSAPLPTVTQEVPTVAVATATPFPTEIPTLEPTRPAPFSAELIAQGGEGQNSILTYNSNDEVIKQLESQGELFFRRIADGAVGARVCPTPGGTCYISAAYPSEIPGLGRVVSTAGGVVRYSNGYIFVPTFPDAINGARFLGVALKNGVLTGEYVKPDGSIYSEAGHTVAGNEQSVVTKPDLFTTVVDGQTFYAGKEVGAVERFNPESVGITFPENWTSRYEDPNISVVIRLSDALTTRFRDANKDGVLQSPKEDMFFKFPTGITKELGSLMLGSTFWSQSFDPESLSANPQLNSFLGLQYTEDYTHPDIAKMRELGYATVLTGSTNVALTDGQRSSSGEVRGVEINLVTKVEHDAVVANLAQQGRDFVQSVNVMNESPGYGMLVFIEDGKMIQYVYNVGQPWVGLWDTKHGVSLEATTPLRDKSLFVQDVAHYLGFLPQAMNRLVRGRGYSGAVYHWVFHVTQVMGCDTDTNPCADQAIQYFDPALYK